MPSPPQVPHFTPEQFLEVSPPPPLELPEADDCPTTSQRIIAALPECRPFTVERILSFVQPFQEKDEVDIIADEVELEVEFLSKSFSWLLCALDVDTYVGKMQHAQSHEDLAAPATVTALQMLLLRVITEDTQLYGVLRKLEYFGRKHRENFGAVGDEASRLLKVCDRLLKQKQQERAAKERALQEEHERLRDAWEQQQQAYLDARAEAVRRAAEAAAATAQQAADAAAAAGRAAPSLSSGAISMSYDSCHVMN